MTEALSITISPQVVTVEVADPNTILTAADAAQTALDAIATAADRVQTGLDVIATQENVVATLASQEAAASSEANAAASAASIRVDSATFATIPTLITPCLVFVEVDETNDGLPTIYFYDGSGLQWLPSVGI